MNFCKASRLSFLTVFLLSTTKIVAVAEATHTQDEKASSFEGFSSEVITSFISLFSSSSPDSDPVVKSSKTSDVSCYNFRMNIYIDETPEDISWEVKNANTGEIIAGKEEGFYSEAQVLFWYSHDDDETICLDMDNSDICYDVVVRDTSRDNYSSYTMFRLFYADEYHNNYDEYSKWTDANETYTVCGFDDFDYDYGCLLPEHEPSCACDDVAYCTLDDITSVFYFLLSSVFFIVFFPCIVPFTLVYALLFYSAMFGMTPWELILYLFLGIGRS